MNRPMRYTLLLMSVLLPALTACAQTTKATAKTATPQYEFKALIDQYYAAWSTGNPESAAPLYAGFSRDRARDSSLTIVRCEMRRVLAIRVGNGSRMVFERLRPLMIQIHFPEHLAAIFDSNLRKLET